MDQTDSRNFAELPDRKWYSPCAVYSEHLTGSVRVCNWDAVRKDAVRPAKDIISIINNIDVNKNRCALREGFITIMDRQIPSKLII